MAYDSEAFLDRDEKLFVRAVQQFPARKPLISTRGVFVFACLVLVVLAAWGVRP
jgi:hypothetical protein